MSGVWLSKNNKLVLFLNTKIYVYILGLLMEYKTNKIYIKDLPASLKIGKCVKSVSNVKLIRKECEDFLLVKMKNEVESACYTSQSFQTTPTHPKTLTVAPPLSAFSWISTSSFTLLQTYLTLNKRQSLSEDLFFSHYSNSHHRCSLPGWWWWWSNVYRGIV